MRCRRRARITTRVNLVCGVTMRIDKAEWMAGVIALLLAVVAWSTTADVPQRAQDEVTRAQNWASFRWQDFVSNGLPPDSATQLVMSELRVRLNGNRQRRERLFNAAPVIDSLWQAMYLNPFRPPSTLAPRTSAEEEALLVAQADLRRVLELGTRATTERLAAEAVRVWLSTGAAVALLVVLVIWRRRRRTPLLLPLHAQPT